MAVVTFMSDFGTEDHYVAAVKAAILKVNPGVQIVDISHNIHPFDIAHASYVLKQSFRQFPTGTVHLVAIDSIGNAPSRVIACKLEDHLFVGVDSGIFSIISKQAPTAMVEINTQVSTFLARDQLASIAAQLASGKDIHDMGKRIDDDKKLFARQPKLTKREIVGNVIRVDHYGNLITNIEKTEFENIQKINGDASFNVLFGRQVYNRIHKNYNEAEPGDCYLIFNSDGNLQIGINKGHAADLLGLKHDSPVFIHFNI